MGSPERGSDDVSGDDQPVPPDFESLDVLFHHDFESLNRLFYHDNGPAEFLLMRFHTLYVVGGAYEEFKAILAEGVELAGHTLMLDGSTADTDSPEAKADQVFQQHYLRIEAHHLKHLAIETLLRLFLGHRGLPGCPWFEMSRELNFGKFKKSVRTLIVDADDEALQSDVAFVILGWEGDPSDTPQEVLDFCSNLTRHLRGFASDWLAESKSYNATKHGLTARPDSTELLWYPTSGGVPSGDVHELGRGDSLMHLSTPGWRNNQREWSLTTRWISKEQSLPSIHIAIQMIRALWQVARVRYGLSEATGPLELPSPNLSPERLWEMAHSPAIDFSEPAFVEFKQPPSG